MGESLQDCSWIQDFGADYKKPAQKFWISGLIYRFISLEFEL